MVRKFAVSLRKSAREAEEDGAVNVMAELSPRLAATGGAGAARRHPRRAQAASRITLSRRQRMRIASDLTSAR